MPPIVNAVTRRQDAAKKIKSAQEVQAKVDAENRRLTEEESKSIFDLLAEAEADQKDADLRDKVHVAGAALTKRTGRQTEPDEIAPDAFAQKVHATAKDLKEAGKLGFHSLADQAKAIWESSRPGGTQDRRLQTYDDRLERFRAEFPSVEIEAAVTGMSQGTGADGGLLLAPTFSTQIWDGLNAGTQQILPMTDTYTVDGESLSFPANAETSRANHTVYGGTKAYWGPEAAQMTGSKPKLRGVKLEPHELTVLTYVTDKLLRNSPTALEQYITRAAIEAITIRVSDAIFNGDGVGKPKGVMQSGCLISVAKETSQAADTILERNIAKMWVRLHNNARQRAVWFLNSDCEAELDALVLPVKDVAGTQNVGGINTRVYNPEKQLLKGRPVVFTEYQETLGDKGDIVLADMKGYASGVRGGINSAMSIHLRFDFNETAFKWVFEVDGQSWLASPLTPLKGTNTQSTFVTLDARA